MAIEGGSYDIDQVAASLRADGGDVGAFVEGLAEKLEDILPGQVRVRRARRGFMGPKIVRVVAIDADSARLELLRDEHDRIETRRGRVSGGIVIKTEPLDIDEWLAAVGEALAAEAGRSERTRQALERLLIN